MNNRKTNKKGFLLLIPFFIFSFKPMNCQACITKKMVATCFSYLCCRHKKTKYEAVKERVEKMSPYEIEKRLVLYIVADGDYKSFNGSSKEKSLLNKRKELLEQQGSYQQPIQNQAEWCLLITTNNDEEEMICQLQKPHLNRTNQNARDSSTKRPPLPERGPNRQEPSVWPHNVQKSIPSSVVFKLTEDGPNKPSPKETQNLCEAMGLETAQ